jgi:hypothetical protein
LLRNKAIWLPNQVWATDITYIKVNVTIQPVSLDTNLVVW